jgi:hypothetical protein
MPFILFYSIFTYNLLLALGVGSFVSWKESYSLLLRVLWRMCCVCVCVFPEYENGYIVKLICSD